MVLGVQQEQWSPDSVRQDVTHPEERFAFVEHACNDADAQRQQGPPGHIPSRPIVEITRHGDGQEDLSRVEAERSAESQ
jgi:hypothetical protein